MIAIKSFLNRVLILFITGFIITFPFPFFIIPDLGSFFSPFFVDINQFTGPFLGVSPYSEFSILSDSTGLYLHLITLLSLSSIFALFWMLKVKSISLKFKTYFRIFIAYYLSLILFKYGFDKIFKHQFYFPEPNTLYTPLNQLSKDILFWSSMGTSYMYSLFSGLIELLPAVLLLHKRTRLFGSVIAFGVLVNVVMINFGFDISVKVFSLFLALLSIVIISPDTKRLYQLFTYKLVDSRIVGHTFESKKSVLKYALLKSLVVSLILFESIGPYVETQNFNDDTFTKPYLNGAYFVVNSNTDTREIKRVFFHRKQYFIIQYANDSFESFQLEFAKNKKSITLISEHDSTLRYQWSVTHKVQTLNLEGKLRGYHVLIKTVREELELSPIANDSFHWTFDAAID